MYFAGIYYNIQLLLRIIRYTRAQPPAEAVVNYDHNNNNNNNDNSNSNDDNNNNNRRLFCI